MGTQQQSRERGMRMVELDCDSMLYGVCLSNGTSDSMRFITDMGDTVQFPLSTDVRIIGQLIEGDQTAIMFSTTENNAVALAVNIAMLVGEWVEEDHLSEGNVRGYRLGHGGAAEGINLLDLNVEGWSIYNGRMLITGSYDVEQFTDTFRITTLTADTLRLVGRGGAHFLHRMRAGEANYTDATFNLDADPITNADFNPEMSDLDVSPDVIEDDPTIVYSY